MTWKKLPAINPKDLHVGCLNCSTACLKAPMDMEIAVGFGAAMVLRDGVVVYEERDGVEPWTVAKAEKEAATDPDHDWRIQKFGPMHGETFQRHGPGEWVCIESNQGFA